MFVVLFVLATTSIFFLSGWEYPSSSSRRSTKAAVRQGRPLPTNQEEAFLVAPIEASEGLAEDDPAIKSIAKLRRELAENYKIE